MDTPLIAAVAVTGLSLAAWIWIVLGRGLFWRMDQTLRLDGSEGGQSQSEGRESWPHVRVIVPARDEAEVLPLTLPSLLNQDYSGPMTVYLVDDQSADGTGELATNLGREHGASQRLRVLQGEPLPPGWTGKLWALEQGIRAQDETQLEPGPPKFFLFTDADISHPPQSLRSLVSKAHADNLDLVSIMAHLRVSTPWERLLIPAFVYFFAKLYPFRWVNDPNRSTAGAAGGCVLLRREALFRAGGLEKISGAVIDDCALAGLIKNSRHSSGGRIWLGLAQGLRSLRSNKGLGEIWAMVVRTAYAQLRFSPAMVPVTVAGMSLLYLVPVAGAIGGIVAGTIEPDSELALWLLPIGLLSWLLLAGSYLPTLKRYGLSPMLAFALPLTAAFYTLMTVDSASKSWLGKGGRWKGRTYDAL